MVVHTFNASIGEAVAVGVMSEVSLVYTVRLCKHRLQTNKSKEETKSAQTHYRIGKFVLAIFCFGSGIELKALCTSSMVSTCS